MHVSIVLCSVVQYVRSILGHCKNNCAGAVSVVGHTRIVSIANSSCGLCFNPEWICCHKVQCKHISVATNQSQCRGGLIINQVTCSARIGHTVVYCLLDVVGYLESITAATNQSDNRVITRLSRKSICTISVHSKVFSEWHRADKNINHVRAIRYPKILTEVYKSIKVNGRVPSVVVTGE